MITNKRILHLTPALLLLVIAANIAWPAFYLVEQLQIRNSQAFEINNNPHKKQVSLTLNQTEFEHYYRAADNELEINGEMYDVVAYSKTGNHYVFKALHDKKETGLNNLFSHYTKHHRKNHHRSNSAFFLFYFSGEQGIKINNNFSLEISFSSYSNLLTHPGYSSPVPPPPKV